MSMITSSTTQVTVDDIAGSAGIAIGRGFEAGMQVMSPVSEVEETAVSAPTLEELETQIQQHTPLLPTGPTSSPVTDRDISFGPPLGGENPPSTDSVADHFTSRLLPEIQKGDEADIFVIRDALQLLQTLTNELRQQIHRYIMNMPEASVPVKIVSHHLLEHHYGRE